MAHGVIKFYNSRGFGFIRRDGDVDLFFHITEIHSTNEDLKPDVPKMGDKVEFEIGVNERSNNRPAAVNVFIRREP